jgi:hypothetical protein
MNKPPSSTAVNFGRPWIIRRPYVYRYLQKQFADEFFATGQLRISSFSQFSKHTDEARFDGQEGHGMVIHNSVSANRSVGGYVTYGQDSYILCGSTLPSLDIASDFSTNSGFRVNDSVLFADLDSILKCDMVGPWHINNWSPRKDIKSRH